MARLGQLLVRANLVSENNLARALGVQHFAGGRLGTLLLERGSVAEDDLGNTLAQQQGCEYVPWRVLGEVPPSTIAALPAKFAIKHSAVPFARGEGYLKVALRDPGDLRILDELFFVTGRKIVPAVAPEVRLYQALEKYYGERRTPRFAILAEKLSRPARAARTPPEAPAPPAFFPEGPRKPAVLPGPTEVWGEPAEPDASAPPLISDWKIPEPRGAVWTEASSSATEPPAARDPETIAWEEMPSLWLPEGSETGEEDSAPPEAIGREGPLPPGAADSPFWRSASAEPSEPFEETETPFPRDSSPPPDASSPRESAAPQPAREPAASHPAARESPPKPAAQFPELARARDRDTIASCVLAELSRRFVRSALFTSKPGGVAGWAAEGAGVDKAAIRRIEIPWNEPSVFLNVRLSRSFYLGPLPPLPRHAAIAQALGDSSDECLVQPILINGRPVAFLYVDFPRDHGATPLDLAFLRELAGAAASAFADVIRLKKREI